MSGNAECSHLTQHLSKQIDKLLIREGKLDLPLNDGAVIYCTCHHPLKVTFPQGW